MKKINKRFKSCKKKKFYQFIMSASLISSGAFATEIIKNDEVNNSTGHVIIKNEDQIIVKEEIKQQVENVKNYVKKLETFNQIMI